MKLVKLLILLVFIGAIAAAVDLYRYAHQPMGASRPTAVSLTVAPGEGLSRTVEQLRQKGLLRHPFKFRLLARLTDQDKRIKAGEYLLSPPFTPLALLDTLVAGKVRQYRLTVPEGFTQAQIAVAVERLGLVSAEQFQAAATDAKNLEKAGIPGESFEGYLFPDTYHFSGGVGPEDILWTLFGQFEKVFTPQWRQQAQKLGFSVHEIVILASIIEKETAAPEERPLIASVFHNRLQKGMPLQSDPTVIYGIQAFDGNLTRKHLKTPTPYNTYTLPGLPRGPIANPGKAALQAALFPAQTDYLYFVAKAKNAHEFSKTLRDHNRAVRRYQLNSQQ